MNSSKLLTGIILYLLVVLNVWSAEYVPEVYQDDYVIVRAGIMETGTNPVHFGDPLTLVVEIDFDDRQVLVENLDDEFFIRSWGSEKGIVLTGASTETPTGQAEDHTTKRVTFVFQVLDCPGDLTACPGHKFYEIPVFSLAYQIIETTGEVVNNKSVRFRPWPGKVVVTQALPVRPEGLEEFSSYFPGGGYPRAMTVDGHQAGSLWIVLVGGVIFIASFISLGRGTPHRIDNSNRSGTRWQNVLGLLRDRARELRDDEWADMMRRCVTWYCVDELGLNPYTWLNSAMEPDKLQPFESFRAFFLEVLNQESIEHGRRAGFVDRFSDLAGEHTHPGFKGKDS